MRVQAPSQSLDVKVQGTTRYVLGRMARDPVQYVAGKFITTGAGLTLWMIYDAHNAQLAVPDQIEMISWDTGPWGPVVTMGVALLGTLYTTGSAWHHAHRRPGSYASYVAGWFRGGLVARPGKYENQDIRRVLGRPAGRK